MFFTATGVFGPGSATAEDVAEPRVSLDSAWVVAAEGDDGERLVPGPRPEGATERLVTARFRYEGEQPAVALRIELAVPDGTAYVAGSATGPGAVISYSVDAGRTFGTPASLTVPADPDDPGGAARAAGPGDYSHIRWELPGVHPPGLAGLVSFRVTPLESVPDTIPEPLPEPLPERETP